MSRRLPVVLIALVGTAGLGLAEVMPGAGEDATITRTRRYLVGAPETREALVDGVLRAQAECKSVVAAGCAVDYRIRLSTASARGGLGLKTGANEGGSRAVIASTGVGYIRIPPH